MSASGELELLSYYKEKATSSAKININNDTFHAQIVLSELNLWEIGCGRLYDLEIRFGEDVVKSYFGMREVSIKDNKFSLNNNAVFLRAVLDHGFYPDGIYTTKEEKSNVVLNLLYILKLSYFLFFCQLIFNSNDSKIIVVNLEIIA